MAFKDWITFLTNLLFNDLYWHILLLLLFNCIIYHNWFMARTLLQYFIIDQQCHRTAGRCHTPFILNVGRTIRNSRYDLYGRHCVTITHSASLCYRQVKQGIRVVNTWTCAIAVARTAQVINIIRVCDL